MKCPHCNKQIQDKLLARYLASKGGKSLSPLKRATVAANLPKPSYAVVREGKIVSRHFTERSAAKHAARRPRTGPAGLGTVVKINQPAKPR